MTPEVERIFHEVADLSPAGRERYYSRESIPAETRREVELLVAHDAGAAEFLARPIGEEAGPALARMLRDSGASRCGPYQLMNLIGAGGMGAVYRARRDDGEVAQEVAVKLLNFGARDPAILERFLQERQILASLSHPNIARLLDAGHSAQGQPYLAMEFVDGVPIDEYCGKLPLRARIALFLEVCDAVSHAHRNLVVHRDLKPANVLVDAAGRPKLLDFGIAKILGFDSTPTVTGRWAMTPEYASPEQAAGRATATSTDIYSLGALLYKLLTGRSPHQFGAGTADSVVDAICRQEPPPASRFAPAAKGDLDAILRKALRKEPVERYATADQFADDLRCYLESRPVRARQGETFYRLRKFLRRRWLPVSAVVVAILSLAAGLVAAQRQRALAEQRFRQVRRLAGKVLALDEILRNLSGSTKARHEVVAMSKEYLEALAAEAHTDTDLALEIAAAHSRLARVQGVPVTPNLGRYDEADETLRKGQELVERLLAAAPGNRHAQLISAEIAHDRMILADTAGRREDALAQARLAAQRVETWLSQPGPPPPGNRRAVTILNNLALAGVNLRRFDDAVRYARRSLEVARTAGFSEAEIAGASTVLANALRQTGDLDGALDIIRHAVNTLETAAFPTERQRFMLLFPALWRMGVILGEQDAVSLDRPDEAAAALRQALEFAEDLSRKDAHDATSRILAGSAARELGAILCRRDPRAALEVYNQGIRRLREVRNDKARREEAALLAGSAYSLRSLGRLREAGDRVEEALRLLGETKDLPAAQINPGDPAGAALRAWGDQLAGAGQAGRADEAYKELIEKMLAAKTDPENDLGHATTLCSLFEARAAILRRLGRTGEAEALAARRRDLWRHWDAKLPGNAFVQRRLAAASASPVPR